MNKIDITKDSLLNIEQICQKLSISRSTFERLRGITNTTELIEKLNNKTNLNASEILGRSKTDEELNDIPFPKPSCMIGRSPRWTANVINEWLHNNSKI